MFLVLYFLGNFEEIFFVSYLVQMAPKKKSKVSTEASTSRDKNPKFNSDKFVSEEAEKRFDSMRAKKVLGERGMEFDSRLKHDPIYNSILVNIEQRGWKTLVQVPYGGIKQLVIEFYANIPECRKNKCFVRGKWVPFDINTINGIFKLVTLDPEEDEYVKFIEGQIDFGAVINRLCKPGSQWVMSNGKPRHLMKADMTKEATAWTYFVCANLLPVSHVSSITVERVLLIYAIMEGYTIDIGKVINSSLKRFGRGGTTGGLGHASTVTTLCQNADTPSWTDDLYVRALPTITAVMVNAYGEQTVKRLARANLAGAIPEENEEEEIEPMAEDAHVRITPPTDPYMQFLAQQNSHIIQQNDFIYRQNSHLMQYYAQRSQYDADHTTHINSLLGRWDQNQQDPIFFQQPPLFPPFDSQPPYPQHPPQPPY